MRRTAKSPNPDALRIFVADRITIPADVRRMELADKERYERIRETLGRYCGIVWNWHESRKVKRSAGLLNMAPPQT